MAELSVFVDESGNSGSDSKYYLLTLVFHDQTESIYPHIAAYEKALSDRGLDNIPFHLNPLMRGGDVYENLPADTRKRLLTCFSTFANKVPYSYQTFSYEKRNYASDEKLFDIMRRDLIDFLFDNLALFQSYERVKIYYDNGQGNVTRVLHSGFEYALGSQVITYRDGNPHDYRLQQVADFVCGIELAALKYANNEQASAERIFFGLWRDFNKGFLKKQRKHLFSS